jgi:DNA-binding XRE family transcriptional regulator
LESKNPTMEYLALNRLRVVLAEKNKTNKWLAQHLRINPNTISKWLNNSQQPTLKTFYEISVLLEIDMRDLFESTLKKKSGV